VKSRATYPLNTSKTVYRLETSIAIGLAIFLFTLPFHLVIKKLIPDPIGTYWKEILLVLLVILWLIRCLISRRFLLSGTPIDYAVLAYLGILVLRYIIDRSGWVGAWGLYISVLYLPVFWLVPTAVHLHFSTPQKSAETGDSPTQPNYLKWVNALIVVMVLAGTLIAVGGIAEFVLDRPLWPSDEIVERQGFSDVYIYSTLIRRVYFTMDSPTALANTLAILLPLSLALTITLPRSWMRILAGISATLIAACIILTFSRGIWVAVVLSAAVMGIFIAFIWRNWKPLIVIGGALAMIVITWGVVTITKSEEGAYNNQGVEELSSLEYHTLPWVNNRQELLLLDSWDSQYETSKWSILDPISGLKDSREVLYEHPPENGKEEIIFQTDVPESGAFRFGIAMAPEVWTPEKGDGVSFQISISDAQASDEGQIVFVRYINPKMNPSDRRWRNFVLDLSPWAGQIVNLSLITEAGPLGDWSYDWGGWSGLQVVSLDPNSFEFSGGSNAILRHTNSILDWLRDETNRDRLAAWNLSLEAWRTALFWGNGLGSTGVAALRTNPESAFVTESQVLKGLVELGIPGFLILAFLWFTIALTGYLSFRNIEDPNHQILFLGILISLLIVFIEGLVYQNLEVKQVNAYFWTIVGILAVLARLTNLDYSA